jgi:thioredoxin reductase (NADPH)
VDRRRLQELELEGEATNLPDGTVEIRVRGAAAEVDQLLTVLRGGGTPGRVTDVRLVTASRPTTSRTAPVDDGSALHDVVVVGGGPAGLSAALVLGRSRRDLVVVDDGRPRNAAAEHVHGYLGLEGVRPSDVLARGREEVERYGVRVLTGTVSAVTPDEAGPDEEPGPLTLALTDGSRLRARRVLVTSGMQDELPDLPGMAERWGRDVLHCPYCHGWEHRDQRLLVLATHASEAEKALTVRQWSATVTLVLHRFTGAPLDELTLRRLTASGVEVVEATVESLLVREDRLVGVRLADGNALPCDAVVVQPRLVARDDLLVGAGVQLEAGPFGEYVRTDGRGATAVRGVWAAGNVTEPQAQVITAAADGARVAVVVDHDLVLEDADRAVAGSAPLGRSSPADAPRPPSRSAP